MPAYTRWHVRFVTFGVSEPKASLNGEPKVDLTRVTRQDLVAYRDSRQGTVEAQTLGNELGSLSSSCRYATVMGWVPTNPSWVNRNTPMSGKRKNRQARFLMNVQTAHFLAAVSLYRAIADRGEAHLRPELGRRRSRTERVAACTSTRSSLSTST